MLLDAAFGAVAGAERIRAGPADAAEAASPLLGAIPSSRMLDRASSANTGPEVPPPVLPGGVSNNSTVIETCGRSAGRYPANVAT